MTIGNIAIGLLFTYAVGISPALFYRYAFPRRPIVKKGYLKFLGVWLLYHVLLIMIFAGIANLIGTRFQPSIHLFILPFIACALLFREN